MATILGDRSALGASASQGVEAVATAKAFAKRTHRCTTGLLMQAMGELPSTFLESVNIVRFVDSLDAKTRAIMRAAAIKNVVIFGSDIFVTFLLSLFYLAVQDGMSLWHLAGIGTVCFVAKLVVDACLEYSRDKTINELERHVSVSARLNFLAKHATACGSDVPERLQGRRVNALFMGDRNLFDLVRMILREFMAIGRGFALLIMLFAWYQIPMLGLIVAVRIMVEIVAALYMRFVVKRGMREVQTAEYALTTAMIGAYDHGVTTRHGGDEVFARQIVSLYDLRLEVRNKATFFGQMIGGTIVATFDVLFMIVSAAYVILGGSLDASLYHRFVSYAMSGSAPGRALCRLMEELARQAPAIEDLFVLQNYRPYTRFSEAMVGIARTIWGSSRKNT